MRTLSMVLIASAVTTPVFANPVSFDLQIASSFQATPGSFVLIPAIVTNTGTEAVTFVPERQYYPDGFLARPGASHGLTQNPNPFLSLFSWSFSADGSNSSIPFTSQFDGLMLSPGQSFEFIAGRVDLFDDFPVGEMIDSMVYTLSIRVGIDGETVHIFSNDEVFAISAVPEPVTIALFAMGAGLLGVLRRRRMQ